MTMRKLACFMVMLVGCTDAQVAEDGRDDSFATAGKADAVDVSPEDAAAIVELANTASEQVLDDDVALGSRTVRNIIVARAQAPFATLADLDAVPYVGPVSLEKLLEYVTAHDSRSACVVLQEEFEGCLGEHAEGCLDIYASEIDTCCVTGADPSQLCVDIRDHLGL